MCECALHAVVRLGWDAECEVSGACMLGGRAGVVVFRIACTVHGVGDVSGVWSCADERGA